MNPVAEILDAALRAAGLRRASDLWAVHRVWAEVVGPRIERRATPIALARGELVVAVADAVWRQELALLAPEIADGVNRAVGTPLVQRIRLVGAGAPA
ncbi:MAG TPA: DUF721 domain-containing protein [Candidatus Bathyarchaeia archaeon]|nr:DUF721 domain-containing protein [Candidatus Bathyarchaeia archaeon]